MSSPETCDARPMATTRAMAVALAVTCTAVGLASPARADERLDGDYTFVNGATTNTWTITTPCTADRRDMSNGWTCPDGSPGPADLLYSFDPVTLVGTVTSTSKPGACNDPNSEQAQQP